MPISFLHICSRLFEIVSRSRVAGHRRLRSTLALTAALCGYATCSAADTAADQAVTVCQDLRGHVFGNASVRTAIPIKEGSFLGPDMKPYPKLPNFCRVVLTASPASVSSITIEVWLPSSQVWNGKLLATGNGGFGGTIRYESLAGAVQRDYVAANTDMGTYPAGSLANNQYDAGIDHPEMVKDWGYRASHEMTLAAKALVNEYYGHQPSRSYFMGCSTGGHQALMEAQRFPYDYDGIIAGAPGNNRTHLHAAFLLDLQAARAYAPIFSPAKVALFSKAIVATCGQKDGGAPGDDYLTNPAVCDFEPRKLLCSAGQSGDSCLSANEVKVLEMLYDGTRNPRTHGLIYPAWAKGDEFLAMYMLQAPRPDPKLRGADGVFRWVFGADWDAGKFDFDHDMATVDAKLGPVVNALNPDLSQFTRHGGKLIMFHGWADPIVSPFDSIVYFDRINGLDSSAKAESMVPSSFSRLFMVPGMSHCQGGPGSDTFGQGAPPDGPPNPGKDIVSELDKWVETGVPPEQIVASKKASDGAVLAERLLCPYPKIAQYNGTGDPKMAASFNCVEAPVGNIEFPATEYLR